MRSALFWPSAIFVLACCRFTHLNALDMSVFSYFTSAKPVSCYSCSSLTSSACKNISQPENLQHLVEECGPKAKGCVKQVVQKFDGTKVTFRECYYAKISTFLFTNLACENISRTALYESAVCYKCGGSRCNSGRRLDAGFSAWSSLVGLAFITLVLRM